MGDRSLSRGVKKGRREGEEEEEEGGKSNTQPFFDYRHGAELDVHWGFKGKNGFL